MDEQILVTLDRLRDDLGELRDDLRATYHSPTRQVTSEKIKKTASRIAEVWMVEIATSPEVISHVDARYIADLNVHFQRLLTLSEHASRRSRYEDEIRAILRNFSRDLIIPLKQLARAGEADEGPRAGAATILRRAAAPAREPFAATAFLGQSFASEDSAVNQCVASTLRYMGFRVVTGEKPKADKISEKIKARIENQYFFVGIFTKRDKLEQKEEWSTSAWVIDEKAYAFGRGKKLILLKEIGVGSIGGIQGDYELINFSRDELESIPLNLMQLFDLGVKGFRPEE